MNDLIVAPIMTIEEVAKRRNLMVEFVKAAMKPGVDYGKVPGTDKPTLFKPGAEKLNTLFGLTPRFSEVRTVEDWTGAEHGSEPFFYYWQKCQLLRDGVVVGEGDGSCNSWEKKYRYRSAERLCPNCGKPNIRKSKDKPEWYCWQKTGGCGSVFQENDPKIVAQALGLVANPEISDQVNTLLKMAQKRALVAACLLAVNASEFFTQDLDDQIIEGEYHEVGTEPTAKPTPQPATPPPPELDEATKESVRSMTERAPVIPSRTAPRGKHPPISPMQKSKMLELYRFLHGVDEPEALDGLEAMCYDAYKHDLSSATYEEGARMLGELLSETRMKQAA